MNFTRFMELMGRTQMGYVLDTIVQNPQGITKYNIIYGENEFEPRARFNRIRDCIWYGLAECTTDAENHTIIKPTELSRKVLDALKDISVEVEYNGPDALI